MDPATGEPLNLATPNPDTGGFVYDVPGYINYHEGAAGGASGGNFTATAAAPHNVADDPEPGIPGTGEHQGDYFVMEFTGFSRLPAGTVRFGVNSDDGFKLTIGSGLNPAVPGLQLTILDGTRGFANSEVNITVTQAGIYPFRLLYWENTGAASGVELFTFQAGQTSGNRYLVDNRNQANAIKAYREALGTPPTDRDRDAGPDQLRGSPAGNGAVVPPAPFMWAEVLDGSTTLNAGSVAWTLDGAALTPRSASPGVCPPSRRRRR